MKNKSRNFYYILSLLALAFVNLSHYAQAEDSKEKSRANSYIRPRLLDYSLFDHKIIVDELRSGNQDDTGENKYYFTLVYTAHIDKISKDKKKTKEQVDEEKKFGEISVNALSTWSAKPKEGISASIEIKGDDLRSFVAKSMKELQTEEIQIYIIGKVTLFESNKKFFFFGKDEEIASISYSPIPKKGSFTAIRHNQKLVITDKKSTEAKLRVIFKSPILLNDSPSSE
jgi:hypothetical protein